MFFLGGVKEVGQNAAGELSWSETEDSGAVAMSSGPAPATAMFCTVCRRDQSPSRTLDSRKDLGELAVLVWLEVTAVSSLSFLPQEQQQRGKIYRWLSCQVRTGMQVQNQAGGWSPLFLISWPPAA